MEDQDYEDDDMSHASLSSGLSPRESRPRTRPWDLAEGYQVHVTFIAPEPVDGTQCWTKLRTKCGCLEAQRRYCHVHESAVVSCQDLNKHVAVAGWFLTVVWSVPSAKCPAAKHWTAQALQMHRPTIEHTSLVNLNLGASCKSCSDIIQQGCPSLGLQHHSRLTTGPSFLLIMPKATVGQP